MEAEIAATNSEEVAPTIIPTGGEIWPATLESLGSGAPFPQHFTDFLGNLGATSESSPEVFACICEDDIGDALQKTVDDCMLSPMERASLVLTMRKIYAKLGLAPLCLGGPPALPKSVPDFPPVPADPRLLWTPPQAAAQPPQQAQSELPVAPPLLPVAPLASLPAPLVNPDAGSDMIEIKEVVDQSASRALAKPIGFPELARLHAHYEHLAGAPPPAEHLPSSEQLAALRAWLDLGRVPYTEFAVWCAQ